MGEKSPILLIKLEPTMSSVKPNPKDPHRLVHGDESGNNPETSPKVDKWDNEWEDPEKPKDAPKPLSE